MEHGTPILISDMEEGKLAHKCGELKIGDAILSVNGESLSGRSHQKAVSLMRAAGNSITMEVAFVVGVTESSHGAEWESPVAERGLRNPPILEDGSVIPPSTSSTPQRKTDVPSSSATSGSDSVSDGKSLSGKLTPPPEPERSAAEKLASAFSLAPDSAPTSDTDVSLYWYSEAEAEAATTPVLRPPGPNRSSSVTAQEVPYSPFPMAAPAAETQVEPVIPVGESLGVTVANGGPGRTEVGLQEEAARQSLGDGEKEPNVSTVVDPDHSVATSQFTSASTVDNALPVAFSNTTQAKQDLQVSSPDTQVPTLATPQRRAFQMRVAAVPIQSLPYSDDTDDTPLFSI